MQSSLVKPSYATGYVPRDGQPAYESLRKGLLGCWHAPLGQTGNTLHDASGRGVIGTLGGTLPPAWINQGPISPYLSFAPHTTSAVTAGPIDATALTAMAWSAWYRCTGTGATRILCDLQHSGGDGLRLFVTASQVVFNADDGGSFVGVGYTGGLDDKWHHAVGGVSGDVAYLYLDGVLVQSAAGNAIDMSLATGQISLGIRPTGLPYNRDLGPVALYDRMLTHSEIKTLASDPDAIVRLADRRVAVKSPFIPYPYPVLPSMTGGMLS